MSQPRSRSNRKPVWPRKRASPAERRVWIETHAAGMTPKERAEYEQTGRDIETILTNIGIDPVSMQPVAKALHLSV